ncbi:hypothetical protein [Acinetobacter sp. YH12086]|uniref:hypothetical protein n=1 Tax=Acinetobacter sp. YH12086 TaxID=2601078 RepID=UPI0015D2BCBA|nr:hypothetical protein [Acinetobacter sp. YH12086]
MNKNLLLALAVLGLVGCATPSYNYTQKNYKSTPLSFPAVGSTNTVSVGSQMLAQGTIVEKDVLYIPEDFLITKHIVLTSGNYEKLGKNGEIETYLGNNSFLPNGGYVSLKGNIDPLYRVIFDTHTKKICAKPVFGAVKCKIIENARIDKVQVPQKDSFQQTLIYNGKLGNKLNIDYREFSSDYARPAFTARVEYDLNDSNKIAYKGAILEIIEANNQSITYKVVQNFN